MLGERRGSASSRSSLTKYSKPWPASATVHVSFREMKKLPRSKALRRSRAKDGERHVNLGEIDGPPQEPRPPQPSLVPTPSLSINLVGNQGEQVQILGKLVGFSFHPSRSKKDKPRQVGDNDSIQ